MCIGKFLTGFIVGGAVGGILGILLAPQSGEETRGMISEKTGELYKSTEESLVELQGKANAVIDDIHKKGDELLVKIQDLLKQKASA